MKGIGEEWYCSLLYVIVGTSFGLGDDASSTILRGFYFLVNSFGEALCSLFCFFLSLCVIGVLYIEKHGHYHPLLPSFPLYS